MCLHPFTRSNMNISATSGLVIIIRGRGKAALGFGPDRIRTFNEVSMSTDSYNGENRVATFSRLFFI